VGVVSHGESIAWGRFSLPLSFYPVEIQDLKDLARSRSLSSAILQNVLIVVNCGIAKPPVD
jgi:hypothetical protein